MLSFWPMSFIGVKALCVGQRGWGGQLPILLHSDVRISDIRCLSTSLAVQQSYVAFEMV